MRRPDREQLGVILLVIGLVAGSVLAVNAGLLTPEHADVDAEQGRTYEVTAGEMADVPQDRVTTSAASTQDSGDTDTNAAQTGIPKPNVSVSKGSQTMNVEIGQQPSGKPVMTLRDDQLHDGRWISIPLGWYQQVLGEVPNVAYIEHESGDSYAAPITVENGSARFYVREFSTNTVTWSGQFTIEAYPTEQGSQYSYEQTTSASNYTINVTGHTNHEWDNVTGSGVDPGHTQSLSVGGNLEPTNGSGGNPVLKVTASAPKVSRNPLDTQGDGSVESSRGFVGDNTNDQLLKTELRVQSDREATLETITANIRNVDGSDDGATVDIYIVPESPDGTYGEGTLVKSGWDPTWSTGAKTIDISDYSVTAGQTYTIEFVTNLASSDTDGQADQLDIGFDDSATGTWASVNGATHSEYGDLNYTLNQTVSSVEVADGAGHTHNFGDFADGETKTTALNVNSSSTKLDFTGTGTGSLDFTLVMQEHMQTDSPSVQVNSNWTNHTGTISDGSTVSLTTNSAWVVDGTNYVNISTSATTSSDDPAMQYDLYYTHDGKDESEVSYQAEHWSESYNISKTFAQDQSNAQLTIPFQGSVISIRNIETRTNGGTWSSVASGDYSLSGTTLTVDLGAVTAGDKVEVRTTGSKVTVTNGSISVSSPSAPGDPLDSKVKVESRSGTLEIAVGGTPDGDRIHYTREEAWAASEHTVITSSGGQTLVFPNDPGAGQSFWVSTLPVSVSPVSGDVQIAVTTVDNTEPEFSVSNGDTRGDDVDYTFEAAQDQTDYILYSKTNDVVRDSGTAQSPLTLSDDDSNEVLKFLVDDGTASSSGSGGGGGGGGSLLPGAGGQGTDLLPLLGVALAIGALVVVSRNDDAVTNAGSGAAATIEDTLGRVPLAGPALGQGLSGLTRSGAQLVQAALANQTISYALIAALGIYAVTSGIIALPPGSHVLLLVAVGSIGALLALQEFGEFSFRKWAAVVFALSVVALQVLRPEPILQSIVESDIFPIIAISGIYLLYELVQAFQARQQPRPIIVQTDSGGDDQ